MDVFELMQKIGNEVNSQYKIYVKDIQRQLRKKSDREIMMYYQRMDKSKSTYQFVVDEARRRGLI
ncbi:MAG: hypothetical protein IJO83_07640 [Clostridia bacterium]|nr:hypothetical protein [Clostridia bacterium]